MNGIANGIDSTMININDLHENQQDKLEKRYEIYDTILKKCHTRIKTTAQIKNNMEFCFFNVPTYIYGIPLYDSKACILYIISALIKNGFEVYYTHPNLLFISWKGRSDNNNKYNNNYNKYISQAQQEYKQIEDYKPNGSLVYNNSNTNNNYNNTDNNNNTINDIDMKLLNIFN
jgi:hypothetical protein